MTDLTYSQNEMFTKFFPVTVAGEAAWRTMAQADKDGVAAVLNQHAKSVIAQLRRAGYSVAKAKSNVSLHDILAELEV